MDKKLDIWIYDTGEGYLWYKNQKNEAISYDYGVLLIKLLYMGQDGFLNVYRRLHTILMLDKVDISNASDGIKEQDRLLDIALKKLDELQGFYLQISDDFYSDVDADVVCMMSSEEEELIFNIIVSDVVTTIEENKTDYLPSFLLDKKLKEDIEKLLDNKINSPEKLNEYLLLDKVECVSQFFKEKDGDTPELISAYHITSLAQLLIIEMLNVIKHRNEKVKYTHCKQCGRFFVQSKSRGRDMEYCSYQYEDGMCQKKAILESKHNISDIEKQCNKILERIRKAPERLQKTSEQYADKSIADGLKAEFLELKVELLNKRVSSEEFQKKSEKWWKKRWKELKSV